MSSQIDLDQAVHYLRLTLPEMEARRIPATPNNYAVWYEYTVGQNSRLVEEVNQLMSEKKEFSDAVNENLYNKHIAAKSDAAIHSIRDGVKAIINELLGKINEEGISLQDYSSTLEDFSTKVNESANIQDIKGLIGSLLLETQKREQATQSLQSTLDDMAKEVQQLRQEVERLNQEASTDPLTRVANRRAFDINMDKAIASSKANDMPLSLILIDIDFFKKFNDRFGHVIGDKVLRFVASILKKQVKGKDTVARFGGEEFAIILPDADYEGAFTVAESIRTRICSQVLSDSTENIKLGTITISSGVGTYQYGESPEELIQRVDQYLYTAKHEGRNKVVGEKEPPAKGNGFHI